jgi:hypothetical protein
MAQPQSPRQPPPVLPVHERNGQHSLLTLLGFKKVAEHIDELQLFYLIGCAYHDGAKSYRRIAAMLRTPPAGPARRDPRARVGENLAKSLRAIHKAVAVLEDLVGERLVNRTGEGLGYDGLTEAGERLWGLVATFVREFWA